VSFILKERLLPVPKPALQNSNSVARPPALPAYVANQGCQFAFLTGSDFPEKHNIAWRIELAEDDRANPLIEPKYPWDAGSIASYGTVMRDPTDELWKMWYISRHPRPAPTSGPATGWILTYAESEDGAQWIRPELDISLHQGQKTNILLDLASGGLSQQASVIVHPDAPPEWRYEMFIFRWTSYEGASHAVSGFPLTPGKPGTATASTGTTLRTASVGKRGRKSSSIHATAFGFRRCLMGTIRRCPKSACLRLRAA
jgi:hypothetical protein